ncbi:hypothetical protein [Spiroplasma endosymbiont of Amphimallon solstitiale]|uniref:hypothetical protein n=1 Tax=Spiroplasma endosymbiont of Amphimallon solstitiale TaxID=3066288 RepID=UPI00313E024A
MLDDLSYVDSKIITSIKKLSNCPNFNELQKDVLEQRVTAIHNFKRYQTDQNLSDNEKAIFKIYLDAILDEDDTNWSEEKKTDFNKVKEWLTKEEVNKEKRKLENTERNGFQILATTSIYHILEYSPKYVCYISQNIGNYYNWVELQIGVIFCIILVPTLLYVITLLIFTNICLKIKNKRNNNFWDAIENCEIINNYYIH